MNSVTLQSEVAWILMTMMMRRIVISKFKRTLEATKLKNAPDDSIKRGEQRSMNQANNTIFGSNSGSNFLGRRLKWVKIVESRSGG